MSTDRPSKGLGMGLSALMGDSRSAAADDQVRAAGGVREIEVGRIRPNPNQPRSHFSEESIDELADSIAERGVLQPILLRPHGDGEGFEIVAGERRWRAAQRARLHTIPAIVREIDAAATAELALIENIQREDLNAIEEAEGYKQLIERHGRTQDSVAKIVHKSRSHVANLLRLLDLPEFVRQSLLKGDISMGHARAVAAAPDPEALTREIVRKGMSVRQAENRARRERPGAGHDIARASARNAGKAVDADLEALERQLSDLLGVRVNVVHKGQGGSVTLHYSSLDQLDMICQRLSGEPI
ncbi:MAG: ParB/RepB/Spo0J family partition protein [Sphingomicrobium sp.]